MRSKRESNIELLRIVAIFFIIAFHYVFKSDYTYTLLNLNTYIIKVFFFLGELGCNLFILITGYFYSKNKVSSKKIIKILLQIYFYYFISLIIGYKLNLFDNLSLRKTIMLFLPISLTTRYWFITAYLLLYIFSPYLNIIINNISHKKYKILLLTSIVIYSIIPTIIGLLYNGSEVGFFFNRFIWVVILYFVGAFINKYGFKFLDTTKKNIICVLTTFIIMILSIKFFYDNNALLKLIGTFEIAYFWTPNNILMLLLSVGIFNLFLKVKFKSSIINIISSTTLGIYLIHDGPLDRFIWECIFKSKYYLSSNFFLIHIIFSSLLILFICVVIDLIRQTIEENTIDKFFDSLFYKNVKTIINNSINKIINWI